MKLLVALVLCSFVISLIVGLVIFPTLESEVNRARANAAYQDQQRLLAQAELERARAGEAGGDGEQEDAGGIWRGAFWLGGAEGCDAGV